MTILDVIIEHKRKEVAHLRERFTVKDFESKKSFPKKILSLSQFISDPARKGIIAEFKRMSPSKGVINSHADIGKVTNGFSEAGASGLSVLIDKKYFGGECDDLILVSEINTIPVLRKDFIIDEYQILEAKAAGADAILLIAAVLEKNQIMTLAKLSKSLNMEVLFEVHSPVDLGKVNEYIDIIGVNNRDLKSFNVNINVSVEMAERISPEFFKISESGISSPDTVKNLKETGYNGFLIGELFMSAKDPVLAFTEFVKDL